MNTNIIDYVPFGRANAVTAKELARRTGYPSVRELQRDIHTLRASGELILSATEYPQGFYRPENDHEVWVFCRSMKSRIREIEKAVAPALDYLDSKGEID